MLDLAAGVVQIVLQIITIILLQCNKYCNTLIFLQNLLQRFDIFTMIFAILIAILSYFTLKDTPLLQIYWNISTLYAC